MHTKTIQITTTGVAAAILVAANYVADPNIKSSLILLSGLLTGQTWLRRPGDEKKKK